MIIVVRAVFLEKKKKQVLSAVFLDECLYKLWTM